MSTLAEWHALNAYALDKGCQEEDRTWLGVHMPALKMSRATPTRAGWATQVPSWPSLTSRSLSAFTCAAVHMLMRATLGEPTTSTLASLEPYAGNVRELSNE